MSERGIPTIEGDDIMRAEHSRTPVEVAAQLWCLPQHSAKEMDVAFAESIATEIDREQRYTDAWYRTAAEFCRGMEYYRGLIDRIGRAIGPAAFTADDGSTSLDVLRAKVPELVEALIARSTP